MEPAKILEVKGLNKNFRGLKAIDDVSFHVEKGQIFSIIGPNGAGKTTLFHLISGIFPPSSGVIIFNGKDIMGLKSHEIASLGISRTFQSQTLFSNLNSLENVLMGCKNSTRVGFFKAGFGLKDHRRDESQSLGKAEEVLRLAGLEEKKSFPIGSLSLRERKVLEMLRAIASEPSLLLLDEPAAGLRGREINEVMDLIIKVNQKGTTIIMVEHQMHVVMSISNRIVVLNYGVKISEGSPKEVSQDPAVIKAYLGEDYGHTA